METLMAYYYLVHLLLVPLSLYLIIFFIRKKGSDNLKNLPPGSNGWPILGENVEVFLSGFPKFVKDRMQKHSPNVFRTSLMKEKVVVLCGAQGNKFVFTSDNKVVTHWLSKSMKKILFTDMKEKSYKQPQALFQKFQYDVLKPEALKQYLPVMDSLAREQLDHDHGWRPNTVVKVLPFINNYTFSLACRLFLNVVDPGRVNELLDPISRMSRGFSSLPIDLPGTAFNRAVKAGRIARGEMLRIVRETRKEVREREREREGRDLLWKMLNLCDEDGQHEHVSDEIIVNFFVAFLMASYETTAAAATAALYFLAQHPQVYEEVLKEQMGIAKSKGPGEVLTWEDLEKMKYSWNVARESLRLTPPAQGGFREATTDFTYAGFTIPKGWKTYWTVYSSHKNPDYFPEPEKFDPSRFEGSGPAPYTYIPFGGGPRICPGRDFAKLSILVLMHHVVTRFRFEKAILNEKMVFNNIHAKFMPAHGLPLHLHSHQN